MKLLGEKLMFDCCVARRCGSDFREPRHLISGRPTDLCVADSVALQVPPEGRI